MLVDWNHIDLFIAIFNFFFCFKVSYLKCFINKQLTEVKLILCTIQYNKQSLICKLHTCKDIINHFYIKYAYNIFHTSIINFCKKLLINKGGASRFLLFKGAALKRKFDYLCFRENKYNFTQNFSQ